MNTNIKKASSYLLPSVLGFAVGFAVVIMLALHLRHSVFMQSARSADQSFVVEPEITSEQEYALAPSQASSSEQEGSSGCGCPLCCAL